MIVVVSGLPRSGTSAVMGMLAAGGLLTVDDGLRAPDDSNPRGYFEDARVRELSRSAAWLADEADGRAVKVIAPLLPFLPIDRGGPTPYRVLFLRRDLEEVLASQSRMLERLGRASGDPELLRTGFTAQVRRAEVWLEEWTVPWRDVPHRRLLDDPAASAAEIAAFLGLDLDRDAMVRTIDPGLYRERS